MKHTEIMPSFTLRCCDRFFFFSAACTICHWFFNQTFEFDRNVVWWFFFSFFFLSKWIHCDDVIGMRNLDVIMPLEFVCNVALCYFFVIPYWNMEMSNKLQCRVQHERWKSRIIARFNDHSYAVLRPVITNLNAFNINHISNFIIFIHKIDVVVVVSSFFFCRAMQ